MPIKLDLSKLCVLALLATIIFALFTVSIYNRNGQSAFIVKAGDNHIKMQFADRNADIVSVIDQLFSNQSHKQAILSILRENYHLYELNSQELLDAIRKQPGESQVSTGLREILDHKLGPFTENFGYYNVKDTALVAALTKLEYNSTVASTLRKQSKLKTGIFRPEIIEAQVLVAAASDQSVGEGFAVICHGAPYYKRTLLLLDRATSSMTTTVEATSTSVCINQSGQDIAHLHPISISAKDATHLIGGSELPEKIHVNLYVLEPEESNTPLIIADL